MTLISRAARLIAALLPGLFLTACKTPSEPPSPPCLPEQLESVSVRYTQTSWSEVEGWRTDSVHEAWGAFTASCGVMGRKPEWAAVCQHAAAQNVPDATAARRFFETHFVPYRIEQVNGCGHVTTSGLITGYYEPVLRGSRTPSAQFNTPLYRVPNDLLVIDLGDLYPALKGQRVRGRLEGRRVVPYMSRGELQGKLAGTEIVWVDDPIDAFFLEIQGSGRVQLDTGETIRLAYSDQNGHPYKAIGRYLVEQGELTVEQATAPGIREWLRLNPHRIPEVLNANPSVVFFKEEPLGDPSIGPKGAQNVPLTAGRSIAVDPRYVPLGAPVFLNSTYPGGGAPLQRLVVAQDTGGAIRGPIRADVFWGLGATAGELAGRMREQGSLWLLWPREVPMPQPR